MIINKSGKNNLCRRPTPQISHLLHHLAASQLLAEEVVLLLDVVERLLQLLDVLDLAGTLALLLPALRAHHLLLGCVVAHLGVRRLLPTVFAVVHHVGLIFQHFLFG